MEPTPNTGLPQTPAAEMNITPETSNVSSPSTTGFVNGQPILMTAASVSTTPYIDGASVHNNIWSRTIHVTNYITLAVSLGFLLLLDLPILLSNPSLAPFFFLMLGALGIFVGCLLFELWAGKRLRNTPPAGLDTTVYVLAIIRNVIIVLNVIPLIQIIGLLTIPLALLFILANAIMITIRLKQNPASANSILA